ncbi:hypothetical protein [Oxobacter pfennigii]|uniref:hypothetical protein n=1 Tax=Oxobacter pfennigii TaxID=36849 RepID=UPI0006D43A0A|nr:hypothetical protein [Oxobacter pfennigii]
MPWQNRWQYLLNQPVGVSLANGQGVSGIFCGIANREIYLLQYLYHTQFATMHYSFDEIQDIRPYPVCYFPK